MLLSLQHCWSIQNERRIICIPSRLSSFLIVSFASPSATAVMFSVALVYAISPSIFLYLSVCEIHIMLSLGLSPLACVCTVSHWKQRMTQPCSLSHAPPKYATLLLQLCAQLPLLHCFSCKVLMFSTFYPKSGHCYFWYFTELSHIGFNVPQLCSLSRCLDLVFLCSFWIVCCHCLYNPGVFFVLFCFGCITEKLKSLQIFCPK